MIPSCVIANRNGFEPSNAPRRHTSVDWAGLTNPARHSKLLASGPQATPTPKESPSWLQRDDAKKFSKSHGLCAAGAPLTLPSPVPSTPIRASASPLLGHPPPAWVKDKNCRTFPAPLQDPGRFSLLYPEISTRSRHSKQRQWRGHGVLLNPGWRWMAEGRRRAVPTNTQRAGGLCLHSVSVRTRSGESGRVGETVPAEGCISAGV